MTAFDLHRACLEGQSGLITQHLESLSSADAKAQVTAKDADGRTPLHWAASSGKAEIVRALLNAGAELDVGDGSGWPALMIASSAGCTEIVEELLYRGANPNVANPRGLTSLHYAASKGHIEVGSALLAGGADVNARDKSKQVPLHRASSAGREAFIKLLLHPPARKDETAHAKTRVNPADHLGNTPLHAAFETGAGAAAVLLIEDGGADRERQNTDGQVPEEIDGVGGNEQRRVREFVRSRVGPRDE